MQPMPIISVTFKWIGVDIVGSLVQSLSHHKFLLVVINYATRYPEAIPLHSMKAETIARELAHLFTWVGIPKQVITNQDTSFMSEVLHSVWRLLGCNHCGPPYTVPNQRVGGKV